MYEFDPRKSVWITWERQPRNISMAALLDVKLVEIISKRNRIARYPILILKTFFVLIKERPRFVFVQNPSIVLSCLVASLGTFLPFCVVVDAHNAGIFPLEGRSKILNYFAKAIAKMSDFTIVSNKHIALEVVNRGGLPVVFHDPLPYYKSVRKDVRCSTDNTFLFICTWAEDEPFLDVIKAFSELGDAFKLRVTGNYKKKLSSDLVNSLPSNITLLGFISECDYEVELYESDFTIDLTLRENCLVCGAYESISMQIPGIISDSIVNKEVFSKGFIYCENNKASIKEAAMDCVKNKILLYEQIRVMKEVHISNIDSNKSSLVDLLDKWRS